ncbi:MAG: large conductance mechanosensitive channel [Pirellulaceae bacterium]|jgi:large conductance mechanosensitive channel
MGMIQEFKEFAMRGNVVDMAVGVVIGGAFGGVVKSFVADVVMPPIGAIIGGVDFSDMKYTLAAAVMDGAKEVTPAVSINYGTFATVVINFLIVAFAIFMVIKAMNAAKKRMEGEQEEAPKEDPKPSDEVVLLTQIRDALANK